MAGVGEESPGRVWRLCDVVGKAVVAPRVQVVEPQQHERRTMKAGSSLLVDAVVEVLVGFGNVVAVWSVVLALYKRCTLYSWPGDSWRRGRKQGECLLISCNPHSGEHSHISHSVGGEHSRFLCVHTVGNYDIGLYLF